MAIVNRKVLKLTLDELFAARKDAAVKALVGNAFRGLSPSGIYRFAVHDRHSTSTVKEVEIRNVELLKRLTEIPTREQQVFFDAIATAIRANCNDGDAVDTLELAVPWGRGPRTRILAITHEQNAYELTIDLQQAPRETGEVPRN